MNAITDNGRLSGFSKERTELLKFMTEARSRQSRAIALLPREGKGGRFGASLSQQRLWFLDQLEGAGAAYFMPLAIRLTGDLDRDALGRALDALVGRHESLRTVFEANGGEALQIVLDEASFALKATDLSDIPAPEQEVEIRRAQQIETGTAFDLGKGPLIRGQLLRLGTDEHLLLVTVHHIISDGWSLGVFIRELAEFYGAFKENRAPSLPSLTVQFADYANWQKTWLQGAALESQLQYWRERLSGAPEQLDLPTDRPRPVAQSYRGRDLPVRIGAASSGALRACAQRHGITLFMVLYAAWAVVLSRLSGQNDIAVGTPVANRRRPELENLIGFFVNTLVLRVQAEPDLTVAQFLAQVKEVTLGAYDHQDVSFERVLEAVAPPRSLSRNPVFQVMFALQNAPSTELQLPGLTAAAVDEGTCELAKFDLELLLEERGEEIAGSINYATDLFDRETVTRWVESFSVVLRNLAACDSQPIGDLPLLCEQERQRVVVDFNRTEVAYPTTHLIHQLFETRARETPDAIALSFEGQSLTYAALDEAADRLAAELRNAGIGPNDLVGVRMERSPEMTVALLGVLKSGGAYVPVDPGYPAERTRHILENARPRVLLTQAHLQRSAPGLAPLELTLDQDREQVTRFASSGDSPPRVVSLDDLAYVIYTSGSTGLPKGAMNAHRGVLNRLQWMQDAYRLTTHDRVLQKTPFSFDVSVWEFFWTLMCGARLIVARPGGHQDPMYLQDLIEKEDVTRLHFVPSMLQAFLDRHQPGRCPSLRHIVCSGEELPAALKERCLRAFPDARLSNLYGPTEAAVDVTYWDCQPDPSEARVPIGRPISNIRMYILGRRGEPTPIGVAGEVMIGGVGVGRGYVGQPDLTAERFVTDPFSSEAGARLYRTGDLGRWRNDGAIEYLGRNDHQIKLRGFRIELGDIEAQLVRHPGVNEAVVIAREDSVGDKRLVAYLTARGAAPDGAELRAYLASLLPEYMVPAGFVVLDRFPLSANGKLDRRSLPAPGAESFNAREYVPPRDDIERTLVDLWRDQLPVERIGRQDNFFELGGHSLSGMKLLAAIERVLEVRLPASALFRSPTLAEMAQAVRERTLSPGNERAQASLLGDGPKESPLAFTQRTHWSVRRLADQPAIRQIASVTSLQGSLDLARLRHALDALAARHEALRCQVVSEGAAPRLRLSDSKSPPLVLEDLSLLDETARAAAVRERVDALILTPIDVRTDPLWEARLLRLQPDEHLLVVVMEHLISDAHSLALVVRDLLALYAGSVLPPVSVQWPDYARRQQAGHESWLEQHGDHWRRRLVSAPWLSFPEDDNDGARAAGWGSVPVRIERDLVQRLRDWSRRHQTTLVLTVLTAYAASLLRWCQQQAGVIQVVTDGRDTPELADTVGFFASHLHLRIEQAAATPFADLLQTVTQEYCVALEHADAGLMHAEAEYPQLALAPSFNWIPQIRTDVSEAGELRAQPMSSVLLGHPMLRTMDQRNDPALLVYEAGEAITAELLFPRGRFSQERMQRLASTFETFLEAMAADDLEPVRRTTCVRS